MFYADTFRNMRIDPTLMRIEKQLLHECDPPQSLRIRHPGVFIAAGGAVRRDLDFLPPTQIPAVANR